MQSWAVYEEFSQGDIKYRIMGYENDNDIGSVFVIGLSDQGAAKSKLSLTIPSLVRCHSTGTGAGKVARTACALS